MANGGRVGAAPTKMRNPMQPAGVGNRQVLEPKASLDNSYLQNRSPGWVISGGPTPIVQDPVTLQPPVAQSSTSLTPPGFADEVSRRDPTEGFLPEGGLNLDQSLHKEFDPSQVRMSGGNGGYSHHGIFDGIPEGTNATSPTPRAPNINQTAATGINNAIAGATNEMGYRPMAINQSGYNARGAFGQGYNAAGTSGEGYRAAGTTGRGYQASGSQGQGYDAAQAGSQGFNAAGVDSQGYASTDAASQGYNSQDTGSVDYEAAQTGSQGYGAQNTASTGYGAERLGFSPTVNSQNVQAGQIANTDLSAYMNPYEDQVVQSSLSDLDRARQMQQAQAGAQAGAAGAFGGSRQALLEAENNRNYFDQASRTASGLRQAGFQNAQNLGLSDIQTMMQANLANQGANLQADTLTANLAQQAGLANQSAANSAGQFGAQAANQAAMANQAAQNQASQFGAASANQASLSNQNALNQAGQYGASAQNAALMANQAAANRASEFGASAANQADLVNAAASNRASEFGASAANQAAQQAAQQQQQAAMFQAQAANQAQLANQNALNQASQFGAQAQNTSGLANQAALNQAGQFGAQALNTAGLSNQNALNQAGQFGASARNAAGLANQNALNQAGQFGASARNTANLSNQNATNNARQFNANQNMAAQMANQNAGLQGSQQRLAAGNQLGNLANLGFGMGQTVNRNLAQDGAMKQGLNQLLIDAVKNQYAGYTGAPQQSLGLLSQALGVAPVPTSETTSKTPGLFDYLTLGASAMSDMRLKTNIEQVGNLPSGLGIYTWDWTDDAINDGLAGDMTIGVLAQEAQVLAPDAVVTTPSGYFAVDYAKLLKGL